MSLCAPDNMSYFTDTLQVLNIALYTDEGGFLKYIMHFIWEWLW